MKRRTFVQHTAHFGLAVAAFGVAACADSKKKKEQDVPTAIPKGTSPFFTLSLAQWSLHRAINDSQTLDPMDFASKAKEMGFGGLEYVSRLYARPMSKYGSVLEGVKKVFSELKQRSADVGIQNLIIMVDDEGDFAITDEKARNQAVENHHKWVDVAAELGCHSIRVNLFGVNDREIWKETSADALVKLSDYAAPSKVNILVENHGYLSSDAKLLLEVMKMVNRDNCGTLPDFGNFCLRREGDARWDASCVEEYDKYLGVEELMPYAKAVSAKSYDFDEQGNETTIDYVRMLKIVKDAGYQGFIGVEYEGSRLDEETGILKTKELLLNVSASLQTT